MDLVIAVGGGGQHIALSIARLLRIGALADPIEAFVIDADSDSRLAGKLKLFGNTVSRECPHPLDGAQTVVPPFARDTMKETAFRKIFLDDRADPLERELFELFYDEESGGVENGSGPMAGVDIGKGMFANPSVGSAVFASSKGGAMEPLFGKARTAARIFVVGSFLGGTGAGIMHQLIKLVREAVGPAKPMYGAFLLRWFDLPPTTGQTVDVATLLASMGHGLEYFYRYTKALLDASMLLGVPDNPTQQIKAVPAAAENDETLSIYPLLAASALLMLPDKTDTQARAMHRTYGLSHDEHDPLWVLRRKWNTPRGSKDPSLGARLVEAVVLQEIYRSFREKDSDFADFDYEKGRATWGSLIENVARRNNEKPAAFARRVLGCLEARSAQLRFVTWWFNTVFGNVDLSLFGDPRARQLYAVHRDRGWKAPVAFKILVDAFQYETSAGAAREKNRTPDPDVELAEKIEAALLAALRN
ncbi:MAG: hypothetical protein JNK72_16120 [Myxococcales bacterium]|nr:hypothetical protein [Myxococcales bacterium]